MSMLSKLFGGDDKSNTAFARKIIKKIISQHGLGIISFPKDPKTYTTMIIKLDEDAGVILLDEANPHEGHLKVMEHKKFEVALSDKGVPVIFQAELMSYEKSSDGNYYVVPIPTQIKYQQRRKAYRVRVPLNAASPLEFFWKGEPYSFNLYDLSFTGLGCYKTGDDISKKFSQGEIIENCMFKTSSGDRLNFPLLIKRIQYNDIKKQTFLGCYFTALSNPQQKILSALILALERDAIQRSTE